jgi:hypothetical protein
MDKLSPLLSEAIVMYKANETSKRDLTKDCIVSILFTVFGITPSNSGPLSSKSEWLKLLQQQDKDNPGKIDSPVAANTNAHLLLLLLRAIHIFIGCINNAKKQRSI